MMKRCEFVKLLEHQKRKKDEKWLISKIRSATESHANRRLQCFTALRGASIDASTEKEKNLKKNQKQK